MTNRDVALFFWKYHVFSLWTPEGASLPRLGLNRHEVTDLTCGPGGWPFIGGYIDGCVGCSNGCCRDCCSGSCWCSGVFSWKGVRGTNGNTLHVTTLGEKKGFTSTAEQLHGVSFAKRTHIEVLQITGNSSQHFTESSWPSDEEWKTRLTQTRQGRTDGGGRKGHRHTCKGGGCTTGMMQALTDFEFEAVRNRVCAKLVCWVAENCLVRSELDFGYTFSTRLSLCLGCRADDLPQTHTF